MEEAIRLSLKGSQQQVLDLSKSPPADQPAPRGQRSQKATPRASQVSAPSQGQGPAPAPHAAEVAAVAVEDSDEDLAGQEAPHVKGRCGNQTPRCIAHQTCAGVCNVK